MATISVDFNAQDVDGRVRINDPGARQSIEATGAKVGDWVWLSDGELRVGGRIEEAPTGLRARVFWETLEDIIPEDDASRTPEQFRAAVEEFVRQNLFKNPNHRVLLRILPLLERALQPGEPDLIRARAAQAFGYPALALLAIDDALHADPTDTAFAVFRLELLHELDPGQAMQEAEKLTANPVTSAHILVACINVLGPFFQRSQNEAAGAQYLKIFELAERFEQAQEREEVAPSKVAMIYTLKCCALFLLDERERALAELDKLIQHSPRASYPYALRGIESYASNPAQAVRDLHQAVELHVLSFLPSAILAYHYLQNGKWKNVETFANMALEYAPPEVAAANLLEWLGIAEYEQRGNPDVARNYMLKALHLTPDSEHLKENLRRLDRLTPPPHHEQAGWGMVLDFRASAADLVVAA